MSSIERCYPSVTTVVQLVSSELGVAFHVAFHVALDVALDVAFDRACFVSSE
jgi:hypothetical protein